jgi:MoaA/NifB/PqqE/SkfB family radical SAM enzyme
MAELGYIQITRLCNQQCRFCSNPPASRSLSIGKAKSLIDQFSRQGSEGIILTGGEPTLHEGLPEIISYCRTKNISCRIITNGQKLADRRYVRLLQASGLKHLNISIYSCRSKVQAYLTRNPHGLAYSIKAIENLKQSGGISVDVNTVINRYNAGHLCENVKRIVTYFPFINHFVWNNLDPLMIEPGSKDYLTVPRLKTFKDQLHAAAVFLLAHKKTFRIERVPLCYMKDFAEFSTETRKLVKAEGRSVYFLSEKGFMRQDQWHYQKAPCCSECEADEICAGLYEMGKYYFASELRPISIDKKKLKRAILKKE